MANPKDAYQIPEGRPKENSGPANQWKQLKLKPKPKLIAKEAQERSEVEVVQTHLDFVLGFGNKIICVPVHKRWLWLEKKGKKMYIYIKNTE